MEMLRQGEEEGPSREQEWERERAGRRGLHTMPHPGLAQREGDTEVTA